MSHDEKCKLLTILGEALQEEGHNCHAVTGVEPNLAFGDTVVGVSKGAYFLAVNSRLKIWQSFEIADPTCIEELSRKLHEWRDR